MGFGGGGGGWACARNGTIKPNTNEKNKQDFRMIWAA
jgi:hypothetical protein